MGLGGSSGRGGERGQGEGGCVYVCVCVGGGGCVCVWGGHIACSYSLTERQGFVGGELREGGGGCVWGCRGEGVLCMCVCVGGGGGIILPIRIL